MPRYSTSNGTVYEYVSLPDLFAGGTSFVFHFSVPSDCKVRIAISEGIFSYIFPNKPRFPETIAYRLFPAFKKYLEELLENPDKYTFWHSIHFQSEPIEFFTEANYYKLRELLSQNRTPPEEKLKIYWMISAHNVFSDNSVPMSIRLLADETGLSQEQIRDIVRRNPQDFRIASEDFLFLESHYDL